MSTYTPLASATLTSAASSVTIANIPQTYTDLILVTNEKQSGARSSAIRFNSDSGSNYSITGMYGDGTNPYSYRHSNGNTIYYGYYAYSGTSNFNFNTIVHINNYSNTTTYKTIVSRANNASNSVEAITGLWRNTAAISSITLHMDSLSNFASGSTFNLYGIAAGGPLAFSNVGSTVTTDGTYWYHTFTSSGIFTPTKNLTADFLVVAGGGGGSFGGGGAGGLRSTVTATGGGGSLESSLSLSINTNYTITVGGGGTGGIHTTTSASNGVDSSIAGTGISTITSTGGGYGGGQTNNTGAGNSGGSGGGGGHGTGTSGNVVSPTNGGTETANQGYAGGAGRENPNFGGGGGGGAGAQGGTPSTTVGGSGGTGVASSITGSSVTYAGGGGGAYSGTGGTGGGGTGGTAISGQGVAGTVNTGGGGGGANRANPSEPGAGNGGSGIVIIRYAV